MRILIVVWLLLLLAPVQARPRAEWVELDGREILPLADAPGMPSRERVDKMQTGLVKLVESPNPFTIGVRESGEHFDLMAGDASLGEVTEGDSAVAGLGRRELASLWAALLNDYVQAVREERAGKRLPKAIGYALAYLALAALLHVLLGSLLPRWRVHSLPLRLVVWGTALCLAGSEFPSTRSLANQTTVNVMLPCWRICLVIAGATLVWRLLDRSLTAYFADLEKFWRQRPDLHPRPQRAQMLRQGVAVVCQSVLVLGATVVALQLTGVDVGEAVAGAGVVGVGLSLIARDLLSDWFAGVQIVMEDQFGVGDTITVGANTGVVDAFTLRATRLRLEDGSRLIIANSQLRTVINHAQLELLIVPWTISRTDDLNEATALLEKVVRQLDGAAGEVRLQSVWSVDGNKLTLRILVPVSFGQAHTVKTELLRRLTEAFKASPA